MFLDLQNNTSLKLSFIEVQFGPLRNMLMEGKMKLSCLKESNLTILKMSKFRYYLSTAIHFKP